MFQSIFTTNTERCIVTIIVSPNFALTEKCSRFLYTLDNGQWKAGWNVVGAVEKYIIFRHYIWARIFKCLWGPGVDSKEWISLAHVAWRAGTVTLFLAPIDFLKIPALFTSGTEEGAKALCGKELWSTEDDMLEKVGHSCKCTGSSVHGMTRRFRSISACRCKTFIWGQRIVD